MRARFRRWLFDLQTGHFINAMWGNEGTVLCKVEMWMIRACWIWPLKAVAPAAYGYWTRRLVRQLWGVPAPAPARRTGFAGLLRAATAWAARETLSFWLGVEALFLLYYFYKRRRLQDRARPPLMKSGQAMEVLRRTFEATGDIQASVRLLDHEGSPRAEAKASPLTFTPCISPKASAADLQSMLHPLKLESNVEELLREWDGMRIGWHEARSEMTISESQRAAMERLVDDAEMTALKRAEVSGWFLKNSGDGTERWPVARVEEIAIGNLLDWVAWAFFHCSPDEVPEARMGELQELIDKVKDWAEVDFPEGYNHEVRAMRLTMDPIPSEHRPLMYYIITALAVPAVCDLHLWNNGFKRHRSGTLRYFRRPGTVPPEEDRPLVFCHGVGINLMPYAPFINEMISGANGRSVFLVSLPHISMRIQEDVPSKGEMVASISDMLASWGNASAHFVGHSFGSIVLAWMIKEAPSLVSFVTFVDPVCFLLIKPDVCYNFMYRAPQTPTQLLTHYFVARELYIAHSLSRNFFWYQNLLWPEEVTMPALVVLSGFDSIVPAHSVRRYLMAYKHKHELSRLRMLWFPQMGHGEINFGPVGVEACQKIVTEMLLLETATEAVQGGTPPRA